jgi:protoheme IX farnesyltransferase
VKNADVGRPVPLGFPLAAAGFRDRLSDYAALTKPRLNLLVIATSVVGFYVGSIGPIPLAILLHTAVGSALVAGGASGLNQLFERDTDRLMQRTRLRPLPDGRLSAQEARLFSYGLASIGLLELALSVNLLAALVALVTLVLYAWVYTPMKRHTPAATLVGALPGALPPLIGWAGARGSLPLEAWTLFAIVFCWQIPHFFAIAWLYRDDYRLAGFPMLPVIEPDGQRTGRQAVIFAALLALAAASPFLVNLAGPVYLAAAVVLSLGLLALAVRFALERSVARARWLFFGSLVYLPALWALLAIDRVGP